MQPAFPSTTLPPTTTTCQVVVPGAATAANPAPALPAVDQVEVWGTQFARLTMDQTLDLAEQIIVRGKPEYLVTANLNYLMLTEQHPRLEEVNQRSAAVIADGAPIVWRSRLSSQPLPARVAGADLIVRLSQRASERGYRIFLLGGSDGVAQAAANQLLSRFPELQIAGCYAPPFRTLTAAEHAATLKRIRDAEPDVLLVAFGQPKGEFWIYDNLCELRVPLSIQIGASFDFLAGTATRAPAGWQRVGCEWLYRALSDPRRLGPRYARNLQFLFKKIISDITARLDWRKRRKAS